MQASSRACCASDTSAHATVRMPTPGSNPKRRCQSDPNEAPASVVVSCPGEAADDGAEPWDMAGKWASEEKDKTDAWGPA